MEPNYPSLAAIGRVVVSEFTWGGGLLLVLSLSDHGTFSTLLSEMRRGTVAERSGRIIELLFFSPNPAFGGFTAF